MPRSAPRTEPEPTADLVEFARLDADEVLRRLSSGPDGLDGAEASRRLAEVGPNAIRSHGARPLLVLARQLRNPLMPLLVTVATVSFFVGERADALIIGTILALSICLGFVNEFRSERAVEELHSRIRHLTTVIRNARAMRVDVTDLVPGDVVRLGVGDVVPADLRLLETNRLECDEAVLTGESMPAEKTAEASGSASGLALACCVFMGTVLRAGSGTGVVVRTGARTEFGRIAMRLGERPGETAFQLGLRDFSYFLVRVTAVLCIAIFVINSVLRRSVLESALFALAIAVGLTPELLPAIVTIGLATGARRLAERFVVVKRLVSIEDLGNIEILFTDKTGTLTEGEITFDRAERVGRESPEEVTALGLVCSEPGADAEGGGSPLDRALARAFQGAGAAGLGAEAFTQLASVPFDYERRLVSVLARRVDGHKVLIAKGAPEAILDRSVAVTEADRQVLSRLFDEGARVVAVATKPATNLTAVGPEDEHDLRLAGFLVFSDPAKDSAAESLRRLGELGIKVKIVTGDNDKVAAKVCVDLGFHPEGSLSGDEIDLLDDAGLAEAVKSNTIFARVSPEQKSRIIRAARAEHLDVGFLGDGVNDAVALHDADVGISVDTAADVAKDAADIVLLRKDLGVLADGVVEGRRVFSNTIKYVRMATSSNFGNMFSAAGASLFLKFLPMLPTQILLNNLLYDTSQTAIPTDRVDEEMLRRPAQWDMKSIKQFMAFFGPISSVYDFLTFAIMLRVFHAGPTLFHTGWFVESLATQTLVVFVIRTRRVPFLRSMPSVPLLLTVFACAATGVVLPYTSLAKPLGFTPLPASFLAILAGLVVTYLALAEIGKAYFFSERRLAVRRLRPEHLARRRTRHHRRVQRLAQRWSRHRPVATASAWGGER